ncbi:MAG TPA: hypothetical protein DCY74_05030 [Clostridiales bacterium]|nr:hypothetical protein [Clostridiales bacterium]HBE13514.1 hypothetical protein [Clostridiales bacterium]HCG35910.1 hypothetical protein [Clostridiales bacterium]
MMDVLYHGFILCARDITYINGLPPCFFYRPNGHIGSYIRILIKQSFVTLRLVNIQGYLRKFGEDLIQNQFIVMI